MKACFILVDFLKKDICCKFFEGIDCCENIEAMKELAFTLGADPGRIRVCYDADVVKLEPVGEQAKEKPAAKKRKSLIDNPVVMKKKYSREGKFPGVGFHKKSGKWQVTATVDGKYKYIGQYATQEQAIEAKKRHDIEFKKKTSDNAEVTWWECKKCSYEFEGEPPFKCPKCESVEFVKTGRPIKKEIEYAQSKDKPIEYLEPIKKAGDK